MGWLGAKDPVSTLEMASSSLGLDTDYTDCTDPYRWPYSFQANSEYCP